MKKYKLTLILAFLLIISGFFGINAGSAEAYDSGCVSGGTYSSTTGQPCGSYTYNYYSTNTTTVALPPGCTTYSGYSVLTGQPCSGQPQGQTTYAPSYIFTRELAQGSRGEDVATLQQLLLERGYTVGIVDGIYGRATKRAVLNYQFDIDLNPTGRADMQTLTSLSSYNSYPPVPCPMTGDISFYPCQPVTGSPTISSVSGPQTLGTNQLGTWTIIASDYTSNTLTYSVDWGDQPFYLYGSSNVPMLYVPQQSATFTHTYSQAGTYTPVFTVTNSFGQSANTKLSVTVGGGYSSGLLINTTSLPNGTAGVSYSASISASGGSSDYFWSVSSGSLPPGLSLAQSAFNCFIGPCPNQNPATIIGTPTLAGTYNFTVQVTSGSQIYTKNFTLVISQGSNSSAPTISSLSPVSGPVGTQVVIYGSRLSGATLKFGGYTMLVSYNSDSQITFTIPVNFNNCLSDICVMQYIPVTPGSHNIYVSTAYGTSNTLNFTVTDTSSGTPLISYLSPSSGVRGSNVTVYGNVDSSMNLIFGGYPIPIFSSGSFGQINFTVPYFIGCAVNSDQGCFPVNPGTSYIVYVTKNGQSSNVVNFYVYPY